MSEGVLLLAAAQGGGGGDGGLVWLALAAGAVMVAWWRHDRHVRRYPEKLKCGHCGGSGKVTDKTLLSGTVRGRCPECDGDAWAPRRKSGL